MLIEMSSHRSCCRRGHWLIMRMSLKRSQRTAVKEQEEALPTKRKHRLQLTEESSLKQQDTFKYEERHQRALKTEQPTEQWQNQYIKQHQHPKVQQASANTQSPHLKGSKATKPQQTSTGQRSGNQSSSRPPKQAKEESIMEKMRQYSRITRKKIPKANFYLSRQDSLRWGFPVGRGAKKLTQQIEEQQRERSKSEREYKSRQKQAIAELLRSDKYSVSKGKTEAVKKEQYQHSGQSGEQAKTEQEE